MNAIMNAIRALNDVAGEVERVRCDIGEDEAQSIIDSLDIAASRLVDQLGAGSRQGGIDAYVWDRWDNWPSEGEQG